MNCSEGVIVIGAGAAGIAAAISVARSGEKVFLLEKTAQLGGTVTHSLIHTLGGLYNSAGEYVNEGLPIELTDRLLQANPLTCMRKIGRTWTLSVSPDIYQKAVDAWVGEESKIEVLYNSEIAHIEANKDFVHKIKLVSSPKTINLEPTALIDATGSAAIIRMIDPGLVVENPHRAAGGLIFQMRDVEPGTLQFPGGINLLRAIRQAAQDGMLPSECSMAWVDTGVHEDEVYVKLFVPLEANISDPDVKAEVVRKAKDTRDELVNFLVRRPEFSKAKVTCTGELGVREEGRIKGEYCLTEEDVREARKFPDAACRCSWPVEYWDPETGVSLEYLSDNDSYDIPLRTLKVQNMKNLWAAGKCLSAEPRAQSSARVAGCCWAMGEAVGKAAVNYQEAYK